MHATLPLLIDTRFPRVRRQGVTTLQLNLGYTCNQSCLHCHVNAGPKRTEQMAIETIEMALNCVKELGIKTMDLTGGAPEINVHFRYLVRTARAMGVGVMDRCNLTILHEPGYETLAEFLADQGVQIVASLPCYSQENVDRQRGEGVFNKSIAALQQLNALGYGRKGSGLLLNLVFNPQGAVLPPSQIQLQADYKRRLFDDFGIEFNQLFVLANMPIQRFGSTLVSKGLLDTYMTLLRDHHQDANLESLMCRDTVSVDWLGYLYDCDFNQMLGLNMTMEDRLGPTRMHLRDLGQDLLAGKAIRVADHCYGCSAGQGSSCTGALA